MAVIIPAPGLAQAVRLQCRSRKFSSSTAGLAPGHIQANLLVLPRAYAADFVTLCERNPVTCPLLATGSATALHAAGGPALMRSAFDIRTDLPRYNVYRGGAVVAAGVPDLTPFWAADHVAFLIGCSFSFEGALAAAGLPPRHVRRGTNVAMFRTTRALSPAGVFSGATAVVSMRPYRAQDVARVRAVTRPFVRMHGEPIAWGWDAVAELGIADIRRPEFGDAVDILDGEVPVFWGCGVTTAVAVMEAKDKIEGLVLSHEPGHMLVLDVREEEYFGSRK